MCQASESSESIVTYAHRLVCFLHVRIKWGWVGCGGESGPIIERRTHPQPYRGRRFPSIARGHFGFENHAERRGS